MKIRDGAGIEEKIMENGLLAAAEAEIFACPQQTHAELRTVICHNIDLANTNTVQLFLQPNGGVSRRIVNQDLLPGESLKGKNGIVEPLEFDEGDALRGMATNADEVTWTISGVSAEVI